MDKNKILDASRAAFAKHGYRKASLSDIARPLGVAKTAFYHYFPGGKRQIFDAVIQREEDALLEEMQHAINACTAPQEQLKALILTKLIHLQGLREFLDVSRDVGEEIAQIYNTHETALHEAETIFIQDILRQGREEDLFQISDLAETASTIRRIFHHLELSFIFENSREQMEKNIDALLKILFYGIVHPHRRSF